MPAPSDYDEFAYIEWIRAHVSGHSRLTLGIGDDTASLHFPAPADCLITVDMLLEGVHFQIPPLTPRNAGRKALAVNLSDLAAMAGQPLAAVVSVAFPRGRKPDFHRELHRGIQELADQFGVAVAGGDTNTWDGPLVISVSVVGEATGSAAVRRNGARVGDWILTTGSFGGSLAGKHVSFQPRVDEALQLHQAVSLHAMIDVSDGLAADLHHVLQESGVGAVLSADAIPISEAARSATDERTALERALGDGEDFELLFTVTPQEGRKLLSEPPVDVKLSHIGEIVESKTCEIEDSAGVRRLLPPTGWTHAF